MQIGKNYATIMYIARTIERNLRYHLDVFPCVALTGPRQSGKSTLVRHVLPEYAYVSFDDPDEELALSSDPTGYLSRFDGPVILDEVQRVPFLFRYLKMAIDTDPTRLGRFALTASNQLALQKNISESLAGRMGLLSLLPFERREFPDERVDGQLLHGSYPGPVTRGFIGSREWYASYLAAYLERDVRLVYDLGRLSDFQVLIRLIAARCSQEQNASSLAREIGVTSHTVEKWISVLQSGYLCFALLPFPANLGKRLIKRPKLYFWDTGLVCHLTGLRDRDALEGGPLHGPLFESLVVAELKKAAIHRGLSRDFWFYRDNAGLEVDLIVQDHDRRHAYLIEIKTSHTAKADWAMHLERMTVLMGPFFKASGYAVYSHVVYRGETRRSWPRPGCDFYNVDEYLRRGPL